MSSLIKFLKTIRNNWKKSTVAALLLAYGLDYGKTRYEIFQMMRAYCEESKKFGDVTMPVSVKPRHLTVILNPASKTSKGPALFDKYASPLLHLAGIRVSIIKTEHEGQAKDLMGVMDNTDAVLIAGGDGTVLEVITGLCRRDDSDSAVHKFPLGIIPIGRSNTVAKRLFWGDHQQEARLLAETAMAVIRGNTRHLDVMSIKANDSEQSVYALASIEWGRYRDVNTNISKYWYWGPLKAKMAYLFASIKKQTPPMDADLFYTLPCNGCSKCYLSNDKQTKPSTSSRWWHTFIPRKTRYSGTPIKDYSGIINENCGVWKPVELSTIDISIETCNMLPLCKKDRIPSLCIKIGPESVRRTDFLLEGWKRMSEEIRGEEGWDKIIEAKDIKLEPKIAENLESWFCIDNESHEVKPIEVRLLPNKVQVFCKSEN